MDIYICIEMQHIIQFSGKPLYTCGVDLMAAQAQGVWSRVDQQQEGAHREGGTAGHEIRQVALVSWGDQSWESCCCLVVDLPL